MRLYDLTVISLTRYRTDRTCPPCLPTTTPLPRHHPPPGTPTSHPPVNPAPLPRFPCTRCLPACASGAARVSSSIASHGGGSTARVDFLSPPFLELRTHAGWTRLLYQVNLLTEAPTGLISPPPGSKSSQGAFFK